MRKTVKIARVLLLIAGVLFVIGFCGLMFQKPGLTGLWIVAFVLGLISAELLSRPEKEEQTEDQGQQETPKEDLAD